MNQLHYVMAWCRKVLVRTGLARINGFQIAPANTRDIGKFKVIKTEVARDTHIALGVTVGTARESASETKRGIPGDGHSGAVELGECRQGRYTQNARQKRYQRKSPPTAVYANPGKRCGSARGKSCDKLALEETQRVQSV